MALAIVTGGGSGIGLATMRRLLADGWRVAAFDRDEKALAATRAALAGAGGASFHAADVAGEAAFAEAAAAGPLKALVASAAIARDTPFLQASSPEGG